MGSLQESAHRSSPSAIVEGPAVRANNPPKPARIRPCLIEPRVPQPNQHEPLQLHGQVEFAPDDFDPKAV